MSKYSGNHKTPEENAKSDDDDSGGELTREQMHAKIQRMSKKITSLKIKHER